MITKELLDYIRNQISLGKSGQEIKSALLNSGSWQPTDINEAFAAIAKTDPTASVHSKLLVKKIFLLALLLLGIGFGIWLIITKHFVYNQATAPVPIAPGKTEDISTNKDNTQPSPAASIVIPQNTQNITSPAPSTASEGWKANVFDSLTIYTPKDYRVEKVDTGVEKLGIGFPNSSWVILINPVSEKENSICYKKTATSFNDTLSSSTNGQSAEIGWFYPQYKDFVHDNYEYSHCTIIKDRGILLYEIDGTEKIPNDINSEFEAIVRKIK